MLNQDGGTDGTPEELRVLQEQSKEEIRGIPHEKEAVFKTDRWHPAI